MLALWESTGHPGTELEKYLTEFQVAVDEDGGLCGATGLLATGGAEEVEVRAATVWACELLRQQIQRQGSDVPSYRLDWYLWDLSQTMELPKPHIRTRTVYY